MSPPLNGAQVYESSEFVYIVGGQDTKDLATKLISKINRMNPTVMEKVTDMKVPRVDPFCFKVKDRLVIMGGSEKSLIEVFQEKTLTPEKGFENKSEAFFYQLACYTSDMKLENCSLG